MNFRTSSRVSVKPPMKDVVFLDLREEMNGLFNGSNGTCGFSFQVIHRHVDKTQRCSCWNELKQEADPLCKICKGNGWLISDKLVRTIKRKYMGSEIVAQPGIAELDTTAFFFEYAVNITEEDLLIEIRTDDNGNASSPITYIKTYLVNDVEILRGNNGRVEFIKVYAR